MPYIPLHEIEINADELKEFAKKLQKLGNWLNQADVITTLMRGFTAKAIMLEEQSIYIQPGIAYSEEHKARAKDALTFLRDYLQEEENVLSLARLRPHELCLCWDEVWTEGTVDILVCGRNTDWYLTPGHPDVEYASLRYAS